jgi:hypothetical protein
MPATTRLSVDGRLRGYAHLSFSKLFLIAPLLDALLLVRFCWDVCLLLYVLCSNYPILAQLFARVPELYLPSFDVLQLDDLDRSPECDACGRYRYDFCIGMRGSLSSNCHR